jgi:putative molybdopterin biosynthesis protein
VSKAYQELGRKQVIKAKRGAGTKVTSGAEDPLLKSIREKHLCDNVDEEIINILSQGYSPEELEAAFYTRLDKWRTERQNSIERVENFLPKNKHSRTIRFVGSHDIALNILVILLRQYKKDVDVEYVHSGSLGGLIALEQEQADLAGIHLLDEDTGEYNLPFVKRILPGREIAIVNLVYRIQGLMLAPGNPKKIKSLTDLRRSNVVFVNRQKGSGTRVLLDIQLKRQGISPQKIKGYNVELDNHLTVGSAIAQGKADVGLGIEAAAQSCGLDFLPLFRERYDLVIPSPIFKTELIASLIQIINSEKFKRIVNQADGYDTSETGKTTVVS